MDDMTVTIIGIINIVVILAIGQYTWLAKMDDMTVIINIIIIKGNIHHKPKW